MNLFLIMFFVVTATAVATKIAVIAAVVYPLLQLVKKLIPSLTGWWSFILNIALSTVGIIIATPTDQILTITTLLALIAAIGTSAGVHGTVQNLGGKK